MREATTNNEAATNDEAALGAVPPALLRAVQERMEVLLRKHEPKVYADFCARWEADPAPVADGHDWGRTLTYAAAYIAFRRACTKRGEEQDARADGPQGRILRGQGLIVRLVIRGLIARGEYVPRPRAGAARNGGR